jgi:hypothetical protein
MYYCVIEKVNIFKEYFIQKGELLKLQLWLSVTIKLLKISIIVSLSN